ncbi:bifunctional 2-polyprenyl-6-hydroxyphenol methylase/3-demethylubiquinol 3-O-methyltransferase UbiG [Dyadobacter sp. CY326]|uniref:class I SAM-dependent methyltransferase n=1 Tax=Dyadobacter sp. CY326 TaxID=2907300 RepID=UPI001F473837|nr:class I SAM-dependent methyltransferase [Dyadobacter sp. CY326]MCE7068135.1 class I SAM-dependent methyltransferase [Dyadobacter sp. CY326]
MIDSRQEYQRMYEVERSLWWYQVLHGKVLARIKKHFGDKNSDLRILDAACGTGGLLSFLRDAGFANLTGFDYAQHAIDFSRERNLNVGFGDLKNVEAFQPGETFDVICCNDALYFLSDEEIVLALIAFRKKLKKNGLIIINIHAFEAFSGTHDLAVGSFRRFKFEQFTHYAKAAGLNIAHNTYWPFALSLPILAVRQWQNYQIRNQKIDVEHLDSDVKFPGALVNSVLKGITKAEQLLIPKAPFGSSLFMTMTPEN